MIFLGFMRFLWKNGGFRGLRVEKGSMSGAAARTGKVNEKKQ